MQAGVNVPITMKRDKRGKRGRLREESRDLRDVLRGRSDVSEKREMLRERERSRDRVNLAVSGGFSRQKKNMFEIFQCFVRTPMVRLGFPKLTKLGGKFWGRGEPGGDGRWTRTRAAVVVVSKVDRKVVGERGGSLGAGDSEIGVVRGNRDMRGDRGMGGKRNRKGDGRTKSKESRDRW